MIKKRGLGRDLDALLKGSTCPVVDEVEDAIQQSELRKLPIEQLQRGRFQPRREMDQDALKELADSIRSQGIIQPIVARPLSKKDHYEIIAGERRWRAAQLVGLKEVPAIIKEIPDDAAMAIGLIENIQRENLNPVEEATTLQRLIEEFEMTQQQVAEAVGRSRSMVTNMLRLLNLNDDVKTMLEKGGLEMGHARALLALHGHQQSEIAKQVILRRLTVRDTEKLIRRLLTGVSESKSKAKTSPDVTSLQIELSEKFGAKVMIQHNARGKGKLVIGYNSLDELEGILAHLK